MDKMRKSQGKLENSLNGMVIKTLYHILCYIANQALVGNINLKCLH